MKKIRFQLLISLLAIVVLVLALTACGGAEPAPTPEPPTAVSTAIPEPAAEPTAVPEPTAEPTAVPAPTFDFQDFSSDEAGVSMSYPSDWFSDPSAPSFLIFGTSQKAVESIEPSATDGVVILLTDSTEYYDTTDPVVALEQFVTEMTLEDDASLRGKIATTTIKGKPAATATIDGESNSGLPLTAYFTTIVDGDWIATFIGTSPTAVEADFHDIFVAMVETIELREPTGTAEVGGMTDSKVSCSMGRR
ncbi:MAG: hypothetical protein M5U34_03315 [Chloroflexi bacterium]|nr:hypothetical protein [Chloroflexota bacterium]